MKNQLAIIAGAIALVSAPTFALAKEHEEKAPNNNVESVYVYVAKDGHDKALREGMAKHAAFREENGDPWNWLVYQVISGPDTGTYYIVSRHHTWADIDEYRAFGDSMLDHWEATIKEHIDSPSHMINIAHPDLSHWPETGPDYRLFQVVNYNLKAGHTRQFSMAVEKIRKGLVEAEWPYHWEFASRFTGSDLPAMRLVLPAENWAGMEEPDPTVYDVLKDEHGEEGANELFQEMLSHVESVEVNIVHLLPDIRVTAKED